MQLLRELQGFDDQADDEVDHFVEFFDAESWELETQSGEGFSFLGFPSRILDALRAGAERAAVLLAAGSGLRDENTLTNLVFFARHLERAGRKLSAGEPGFQQLSQEWLAIRDQLVRPALAGPSPGAPSTGSSDVISGTIRYRVKPGEEYGGKWKSRLPPGLPPEARKTSEPGAALPHVEQLARLEGLGNVFVKTLRHLSTTESGGRFALPAIKFNALPPGLRSGAKLVTAWGAFQFNRDAWSSLPGVAKDAFPWQASVVDEISRPIKRYAERFRQARAAGGSEIDAARAIRIWHASPAAFRKYVENGRRRGFEAAWQSIDVSRRLTIDKYLREAGVLPTAASGELADFEIIFDFEEPQELWETADEWHGSFGGHRTPDGGVELEFSIAEIPSAVLEALRKASEPTAIKIAVALGIRDEDRLTNLVFFWRHPERAGRKLVKGEPGFAALGQEWVAIRDNLVRPALVTTVGGIADRTMYSPKDKRKHPPRSASAVDAVVLHQMAFNRGNDLARYDKVTAHYVVLQDGKIAQLHPVTANLWASHRFNSRSVSVEFAGNFPSLRGKCWRPEKYGCHQLSEAQGAAGRRLLEHLVRNVGIRYVFAHRQSSSQRENDPGPDIWFQVAQWGIDNLGLSDGGPGYKIGSGKPIPPEWRRPR